MPDAHILVFRGWPHPAYDQLGLAPHGRYSRLAWLPTVGPTSWLLWGSVVAELLHHHVPEVAVDRDELARSLGVNSINQHGRTMARTLKRLCSYRLFDRDGDVFLVRLTAPPVSVGSLRRLPPQVRELHEELFGVRPHGE